MHSYYEDVAEEYIETSMNFDMSEFYQFLQKNITLNSKILDFGCGSCRDMMFLKNEGYSIDGMDACLSFVEHGKNNGLNVEYGDALSKLPVKTYDCIYSVSTLMHVRPDLRDIFLNNLETKINPNGYLILSYTEEYGRNEEKDFWVLNRDELNQLNMKEIETIVIKDKRGVSWITSCYQKIDG